MTMNTQDDILSLTGAYVLNALTPEERKIFEDGLKSSEQARNEVTELADTAVLLGLAVEPVTPSANLKANLMAQIASTPQLPVLAPVVESPSVEGQKMTKAELKAQRRWFQKPVFVAGITTMAASFVIVGAVSGDFMTGVHNTEYQADHLAAISQASDNERASADVAGGGSATVMWSDDANSSAVFLNDIPQLASSEDYELWYINDNGDARSAGLFSPDSVDGGWQVLDGDMNPGDKIGLTVEPAGGSKQPTTDPVLLVETV